MDKYILKNGMVLIGQQIDQIESAAFDFMLPLGAARIGKDLCGAGTVICDWLFRGAGRFDSRQLSDELDGLGLHRSSNISSSHISVGASLQADVLTEAIDLYATILLEPRLNEEQFQLSRTLALQEVLSLEDDPRQKVMQELHEFFYPSPMGISPTGRQDTLEILRPEGTRELFEKCFDPSRTIFTVAGKYDFDQVCKTIEARFADLRSLDLAPIETQPPVRGYQHIPHEGAQVHIGLMIPAVPLDDPDYYNAMLASTVLSGGMSSRLFTEVREKRGLCYAVGARYHTLKGMAGIHCYAGTTPDKAQETYEVTRGEFVKLVEGISPQELENAQTGLKSSVIMNSESSSARAGTIARDYYMLGRVRPLEEIKENIEKTSIDSIIGYLKENPVEDFTIVTIGPKGIEV